MSRARTGVADAILSSLKSAFSVGTGKSHDGGHVGRLQSWVPIRDFYLREVKPEVGAKQSMRLQDLAATCTHLNREIHRVQTGRSYLRH